MDIRKSSDPLILFLASLFCDFMSISFLKSRSWLFQLNYECGFQDIGPTAYVFDKRISEKSKPHSPDYVLVITSIHELPPVQIRRKCNDACRSLPCCHHASIPFRVADSREQNCKPLL